MANRQIDSIQRLHQFKLSFQSSISNGELIQQSTRYTEVLEQLFGTNQGSFVAHA